MANISDITDVKELKIMAYDALERVTDHQVQVQKEQRSIIEIQKRIAELEAKEAVE